MSDKEPTAAEKRLKQRQAKAAATGEAGPSGISGEDALEAVSDLEGKVETWHLAAEERLSTERVRRDADQARLEKQLGALAAAVTKLAGSSEVESVLQPRPNQEGDPPQQEPEPESGLPGAGASGGQLIDPLEAAEDELLILQAKSEEVESRRARLAGDNPRNLWADLDGGSGGGGYGGRLEYQGTAIRYLRKPYRRQAEVYTRQIEGDIAELQLPEKKVIIGENLVPCYERLHEESQHEVDYLWFALGRFRDVLSSVSTVGFALEHFEELEAVAKLLESRLQGIVEKAEARGDPDAIYDEEDAKLRARLRRRDLEATEYRSAEQAKEIKEYRQKVESAYITAKVKAKANDLARKKNSTGTTGGGGFQGGSGAGGRGRGRGNQRPPGGGGAGT